MYQKIEECPLCQSGHFSNLLICKDHSITAESFAIVECKSCGLLFTNPRPQLDQVVNYYKSDSYISIANKTNSLTHLLYKVARFFTIRQKTNLINSLTKVGTVLDVGCGTGEFLKGCQDKSWKVTGVEPSQAREQAERLTKSTIYSSIEQVPDKPKYELITLWHVLEHLPDLTASMTQFRKLLKKKGRLLIAVPNHASWDAKHYGTFWAGYDVPRHFYHFSQSTLKKLCSNNKLTIERTYPMRLDSFYVSLLSERYQNPQTSPITHYIRAFINGFKSNIWAGRNNNNYSSLIYVIKKR